MDTSSYPVHKQTNKKTDYGKNVIHFSWYMPWVFVSQLSLAIIKCENAVLQPKRDVSSLSPSGFLQPCLVSLRCIKPLTFVLMLEISF